MESKMKRLARDAQWLMTKLKAHPTRESVFQTTINFSGYVSLLATISDLMKLCALAELADEEELPQYNYSTIRVISTIAQ